MTSGFASTVTLTAPGATLLPAEAPEGFYPSGIHTVQVAVKSIITQQWQGELLSAVVNGLISGPDLDGSGSVTIKVATTDPTIDLLSDNGVAYGLDVRRRWDLIDKELHVFDDGYCVGVFVVDGDVRETSSFATLPCVTKTDALFKGRTLGHGKSTDLLNGLGYFEGTGDLEDYGFVAVGDLDYEFVDGYGSRGRGVRFRGHVGDYDDGTDGPHLKVAKSMATAKTTTFHNVVRARAFFRLPTTTQADTLIISNETFQIGSANRYNPEPAEGLDDAHAARVEDDTELGQWGGPFTGASNLPLGPHQAVVVPKVYPQSASSWTYMWGLELIQRDNLSSGVERDLVYLVRLLLLDAQDTTKGKSSLGLSIKVTGLTGIEEVGTWWREDNQPLTDAIEAITSRYGGPDPVWVDFQGRARIDARRGSVRDDFLLCDDNVRSWGEWVTNPRSQVSEVRAETDLGSDYWRHQAVKRDTSRTHGHVVERVTRAPNGMTLRQLEEFVAAEHYQYSQPQETTTAVVDYEVGYALSVGDTFPVYREVGRHRWDRTMRLFNRELDPWRRQITLHLGTDEAA